MSERINKVIHVDGDKIIEELCTVPPDATLDCGHTFYGTMVETIIGMLREHGAVVVFNANLEHFSLLQLGADLAANARPNIPWAHDPKNMYGTPCHHPLLYVTHLLGKGGVTTCPGCKAVVVVDKEGHWFPTPATYAVLSDGRCCNCGKTVDPGTRHLHIVVGRDPYTTKRRDCYVEHGHPVETVADRQAAGKSLCGHAAEKLWYDPIAKALHCTQCDQERAEGARKQSSHVPQGYEEYPPSQTPLGDCESCGKKIELGTVHIALKPLMHLHGDLNVCRVEKARY